MGKAPAKPAKRPAAKGAARGAAKGKPAARRGGPPRPGGKGRAAVAAGPQPLFSRTNRTVILLGGIALVPFALPTLLLLVIGMLPTMAAVFTERGSGRQAWVSVGGLNFAGLSNWLLKLWFAHHTLGYAIDELRTITPLIVAYAGAALGWMLYLAMPPLVNAVTTVTSQRRVVTLAAQQRKLVELWGDAVIAREPRPMEPTLDGGAANGNGNGGAMNGAPANGGAASPAPARART